MRCSTQLIETYPYLRGLEEQVEGCGSTGTAQTQPRIRRVADSRARLATREDRDSQTSRTPGPGGVG